MLSHCIYVLLNLRQISYSVFGLVKYKHSSLLLQILCIKDKFTESRANMLHCLVTKDEKLYDIDNETSMSESSVKWATLFGLVRDKPSNLLVQIIGIEGKKV